MTDQGKFLFNFLSVRYGSDLANDLLLKDELDIELTSLEKRVLKNAIRAYKNKMRKEIC